MKIIIILLATLTLSLFSQSPQADYFIAKDLSQFEILNRYQQKISSAEKQKFMDYTPWEIIDKSSVLGDQLSRAIQAKHNGITYYFVLSEDESFKGDPQTFYDLFENCTVIGDNINVKGEKGVLFREIPFSNKSKIPRIYLDTGVQLNRLFKKGPSYFVKNQQTNTYGWIRINNSSAIEIATKVEQRTETEFNSALVDHLENEVSQINSVYAQLFNHLNSDFSENKIAPIWQISGDKKSIILKLENINPEKLKKSTSYFINDIENIFAGGKIFIKSTGNSITISLSDEN